MRVIDEAPKFSVKVELNEQELQLIVRALGLCESPDTQRLQEAEIKLLSEFETILADNGISEFIEK